MERLEEAKRWFQQALRDLKAANDSLTCGNYEWSCFQAQQAVEKAIKALLFAHGKRVWGHSIVELLRELEQFEEIPREFYTYARELDVHYIASRYPNAFPSGYPAMYYDEVIAKKAIQFAQEIVNWVKKKLVSLGLNL